MIIDIHAHTSSNTLWGLHTQSATLTDLDRLARLHRVKKIILMATYFPFKGSGLYNRELLRRIKGNPLFAMFGSLDVMNRFSEGLAELRELIDEQMISGIKLYPGYQDFEPSDPGLYAVYELARSAKLPVMFHTGELHHCCSREKRERGEYRCADFVPDKKSSLANSNKIDFLNSCWIERLQHLSRPTRMWGAIRDFPDVIFVLSHLGNPFFKELRQVMRECPNVITDISGQFLSGTEEDSPEYRKELSGELKKFLKIDRGVERILFGTDFPIQSYKDSIELIKMLKLSEEEEDFVFYKNGAALLARPYT